MTETLAPQPKAKPILFSLLILLSGIAIGVGSTLIAVKRKRPEPKSNFNSRMLGHLMRELKLTDAQKEEADAIIKTNMTELEELRSPFQAQMKTIIQEMNDEIFETLDDQQKEIWTVKMQEMKDRFEQMRKQRGFGGPGRGDGRGGQGGQGRGGQSGGRKPGGKQGQDLVGPRRPEDRRGGQWHSDRPQVGDPNSPAFRKHRFNGQRPPEGAFPPDRHPPAPPQPASGQPPRD
ncbi:MAG: hypothetical protein ACYSUT_11800 [Planctomycetota bacterium]|jgi:hypothetical protein